MGIRKFAVCVPVTKEDIEDGKQHVEVRQVDVNKGKLENLYEMIGTDIVEKVSAKYLPEPYVMMVDEEGLLRDNPVMNPVGSLLYGAYEHGQPIVGNIVFMRLDYSPEGPDLFWMDEDEAMRFAGEILDASMTKAARAALKKQEKGGILRA